MGQHYFEGVLWTYGKDDRPPLKSKRIVLQLIPR